ncbi:hypothetical protein [Altererythrobacter sp. MTPC7]|uniref:hypothetical protein n=1 Tax=Altererythrobacter sp. MTPC7 TaxID=3056567 RepID=UPI0036F2A08B
MTPQIVLIRELAAREKWSINCTGHSGEMTTLRLVPKSRFSEISVDDIQEELAKVATSIHLVIGAEAISTNCDATPVMIEALESFDSDPLGFGPRATLARLLKVALDCGYENSNLRPITQREAGWLKDQIQPNWVALDSGDDSGDRYGPAICYILMSSRLSELE